MKNLNPMDKCIATLFAANRSSCAYAQIIRKCNLENGICLFKLTTCFKKLENSVITNVLYFFFTKREMFPPHSADYTLSRYYQNILI